MSLGPHCPSFHTNSGGGIDVGKVARAMSATQAEDTPWPGPTGAGSRVLWLQHDPFPALPRLSRLGLPEPWPWEQ